MTRRERLENKLEKRLTWADSRARQANDDWKKADLSEAATGIPFGQPILIGHHSEAKHRKVLERSDNAMRRAHESHEMSKHHKSKANGIARQLETTIFSDDDNAIEALELKIEMLDAERQRNNAINKAILSKPKGELTPEKIAKLAAVGISELASAKLIEGGKGIPSYANQNLGGRIKAARDRIAQIKRSNERKERAKASGGMVIDGGEYVRVTFAEKPEYTIIRALKDAGFNWSSGSWVGKRDNIPECINADLKQGEV